MCKGVGLFVLGAFVLLIVDSAWAHGCTGDCNGDDIITASELMRGVRIAADLVPIFMCIQFDADRDGRVTDGELEVAVNNLFNYCGHEPPTPTSVPTATGTPTPSEASHTPSPPASPTPTMPEKPA
jgi:hypothetical protein